MNNVKNLKRVIRVLILFMIIFLVGCTNKNVVVSSDIINNESIEVKNNQVEEKEVIDLNIIDNNENDVANKENNIENSTKKHNEDFIKEENFETYFTNKKGENEIVVAYFSISGKTEKIAKYIESYYYKKNKKVDVYKIEPLIEYDLEKDFDLSDEKCRYNIEINDLENKVELLDYEFNINKHRIIFLGFPIWYDKCPKIVLDFLKSYDFSNKIIIPFCTSDNSVYGSINKDIKNIIDCKVLDGKSFKIDCKEKEILEWIENVDIQ